MKSPFNLKFLHILDETNSIYFGSEEILRLIDNHGLYEVSIKSELLFWLIFIFDTEF